MFLQSWDIVESAFCQQLPRVRRESRVLVEGSERGSVREEDRRGSK
jgi:hypothetical protein